MSEHVCKCGFEGVVIVDAVSGIFKWRHNEKPVSWDEPGLAICPKCGEACMEVEETDE